MSGNGTRITARPVLHYSPARHNLPARTIRDAVTTLAASAVAGVTLLSGCSSPASVPLPARSTSLHAPATSQSPSGTGSARQQVIAAYTAYFPASQAAEAAAPARAQAILAPYAAQPYLGRVLAQMASYRARDEAASGYVVPHVIKVTVTGRLATVYDCQDASHATLTDTRTGKITPPLKGSARTYLIASLARGTDGRWRITSLAHVAVPCTPAAAPPS
jgi:hypothetical protein